VNKVFIEPEYPYSSPFLFLGGPLQLPGTSFSREEASSSLRAKARPIPEFSRAEKLRETDRSPIPRGADAGEMSTVVDSAEAALQEETRENEVLQPLSTEVVRQEKLTPCREVECTREAAVRTSFTADVQSEGTLCSLQCYVYTYTHKDILVQPLELNKVRASREEHAPNCMK